MNNIPVPSQDVRDEVDVDQIWTQKVARFKRHKQARSEKETLDQVERKRSSSCKEDLPRIEQKKSN